VRASKLQLSSLADRRQIPFRDSRGRQDLPHYRDGKGEGHIHLRSVDGRDRFRADSGRAADYFGSHCRRRHSDPDDRSQVQRTLQQGRGLRGDASQFAREMALDMAAIRHAVASYGLPRNLKLSVHSGSDKFSIYPAIYASMMEFSTGVHLKTAGTNWLEELIGLAEAGATVLPWPRRSMPRPLPTPPSYARLMQRSSTSTRPNFPRPRK